MSSLSGVCFRACMVLATLGAGFSGCSRGPSLGQVEGTLTLEGRPLNNCQVTFVPEGEAGGGFSSAVTDQDGRFSLRYQDARPGAALGPHRVAVLDLSVSTGFERRDRGDEGVDEITPTHPPRPSRIAALYAMAVTSPLRAEVKSGTQSVPLEVSAEQGASR